MVLLTILSLSLWNTTESQKSQESALLHNRSVVMEDEGKINASVSWGNGPPEAMFTHHSVPREVVVLSLFNDSPPPWYDSAPVCTLFVIILVALAIIMCKIVELYIKKSRRGQDSQTNIMEASSEKIDIRVDNNKLALPNEEPTNVVPSLVWKNFAQDVRNDMLKWAPPTKNADSYETNEDNTTTSTEDQAHLKPPRIVRPTDELGYIPISFEVCESSEETTTDKRIEHSPPRRIFTIGTPEDSINSDDLEYRMDNEY